MGTSAIDARPLSWLRLGILPPLLTLAITLAVATSAMGQSYQEAVESTGGVAHFWPMGESSGSSFADVIGSATATITGGVTLGEPGGLVNDPSTSALFNGISGAAHAPVNLSGTNKLTVEFWMKWNHYENNDTLALEFTPNFNENAGGFLVDPNTSYEGGTFGVGVGSGATRNNVFFARPTAETWHYYTIIINTEGPGATEITPYVDGKAVTYTKEESRTGAELANSILYWMSRDTTSLYGAGNMQDLALYEGALSTTEIREHYELGKGGPKASFASTPVDATPGVPLHLNASESSSPAGTITDYAWDFDGSKTYTTDAGGSATQTHTFTSPGTYAVDLKIKDSLGETATVSHTITVGTELEPYAQTVENTSGITHLWPMGESSGASFADVVGGSDASVSGGVTLGQPGGLVNDPSTSALFDGISGAAHAPVNLSGTGKLTVEFWMKWHHYENNDALALEFTPNFNENAGGFLIDPNTPESGGSFGVGIGNGATRNNVYFTRPTAETWHYYTIVINTEEPGETEIIPYVDGKAVAYTKSESRTGAELANSTLYWMSRDASTLFGTGNMQDLALYEQALNATEISEHYELGKGGPKASFLSTPVEATAGVPIHLNASESSSPAGTITDYAWDFDGSKTYITDAGGSATQTHTFTSPGTYTVDLRTKDSLGETATVSHTIIVGTELEPYAQTVENTSGIAHFWPMGESSGSSFADVVSGANASISTGGVTLNEPGGLADDPSKSALFDGSSGGAHTPVNLSGTGKLTVEFWMKWHHYENNDALALEFTPNFNENPGGFLIDPNAPESGGSFGIGIGNGATRNNVYFTRPTAETWHYYTIVINTEEPGETEIIPYVDGKAVPYTKTESKTGAGLANSTLYWMSRDASSLFGAGNMQDLALYETALGGNSIQHHYEVGMGAPVNTSAPTIVGTATDGQILSVSAGSWHGASPLTYGYQWQACDSDGRECEDIEGATGASYSVGSPEIESTLRVVVTATNTAGSAAVSTAATSTIAPGPPHEIEGPNVSGSPNVGQVLAAEPGVWDGSEVELSYQWQRCDPEGLECADIAGATAAEYTPGEADLEHTFKIRVGASNDLASVTALSPASTVVEAPSLTLTGNSEPTLSGTEQSKRIISVSPGAWTGVEPIVYGYTWERCDSWGSECKPQSGQRGSSYALEEGDAGHVMRAVVTSADANGSETKTIDSRPIAADPGPLASEQPQIDGRATTGQVLRALQGTWTGTGSLAYAYQWVRCDEDGENCASIEGATAATYTPSESDIGSSLRVAVTTTDEVGSSLGVSQPTPTVSVPSPTEASAPSISGADEVGEPLEADPGIWSGEGALAFGYQWQRCNVAGESCSNVSGATEAQYVPREADAEHTIRVHVTATDPSGSASVTSARTALIGTSPAAPLDVIPPSVSGEATVGDTLTAEPGAWYGSEPISYSYQWQRCDEESEECSNISGASGETYVLGESDVGSTVRVLATASNTAGSETVESLAGETVGAPGPPEASSEGPAILGEARVGKELFAQNGSWSGSRPLTYAYRWELCNATGEACTAIGGATSPTYTPTSEDASHTLRLTVTATNTLGHAGAVTPTMPVAASGEAATTPAIALAEETDPSVLQPSAAATLEAQEVKPATTDPGEELASATALTTSSTSKETPGEFAVNTADGQISMAPIGTAAGATTLPTIVNNTASIYADTFKATDTIVRPEALGASTLLQLRSAEAPTSFSWEVGLDADQYLEAQSNGSIAVVESAPETYLEEPPGEPFEGSSESGEASEETGVGSEVAEKELESSVEGESPLEKLPPAPHASTPAASPEAGELHPQDTTEQYEHGTSAVEAAETHTAGRTLMVIEAPTVIDASGKTVAASLSSEGNEVTLTIAPSGGTGYPVTAQTSVAAPTDTVSAAKGHTVRYGLSDPKPQSFETSDEGGTIVPGFDPHIAAGPLAVHTARDVVEYNVNPEKDILFIEWLKAVKKDKLEPFITLGATGREFKACEEKRLCPATSIKDYEHGIARFMSGVIKLYKNSPATIPSIKLWGAWNEPDLNNIYVKNPLYKAPARAALFWKIARLALKNRKCNCTLVAGEFFDYSRYALEYRNAMLKDHRDWTRKPYVWGIHDYYDLTHFWETHTNSEMAGFTRFTKRHLGHTRVWLSEEGVTLQNGSGDEAEIYGHPKRQAEAAEDFLHIGTGSGSKVDRAYYYLYRGPSKEGIEEQKNEHLFDSAMLPGEGVTEEKGHPAKNPRQAYCVLALGEKGCPAKPETLAPVRAPSRRLQARLH